MPKIFINYRRGGTAGHAGRLFDRLKKDFGAANVFMDVAAIGPGFDFRKEIQGAVGACDVLLVVIGRDWSSCVDAQGRRRILQTDDFVRLEVAGALDRKVLVIPVLVDHGTLPKEEDLPLDLRPLLWRQALELRDARWDPDVTTLSQAIRATPAAARPPLESWVGQQLPNHRWIVWGGACAVVLLLGGGAAAWFTSLGRPDTAAVASAPQVIATTEQPPSQLGATAPAPNPPIQVPSAPSATKPHADQAPTPTPAPAARRVASKRLALPAPDTRPSPAPPEPIAPPPVAPPSVRGVGQACGPQPPWTPLPTPSRSWTSSVFRSTDQYEQRMAFLRAGPPCRSVAAAKRALAQNKLTAFEYDNTIWALKQRQGHQINAEKKNLNQGRISDSEYQSRLLVFQAELEGP